jgi:SAM-dependent methyltransferase
MLRLGTKPITPTQKVADKWSATEYDPALTFFGFPPLRPYRIRLAFGEEEVRRYRDEPQWPEAVLVDKYLSGRNVETVLSLCCGFGHVERMVVRRLGTVRHCLGLDVAPGAVAEAARRAERAGLGGVMSYKVADVNDWTWPVHAYDLVIANGALHHLSALERVMDGVRLALRPGGLLYANEHVGASLQDYPPRQIELINAVKYLLPPALRQRRRAADAPTSGILPSPMRKVSDLVLGNRHVPDPRERPQWPAAKKAVAAALRAVLPSCRQRRTEFRLLHDSRKQYLLRMDPSEGVRSAEIIPLLRKSFAEVEVRPYGGAILAYALDATFYRAFRKDDPCHRDLLGLLCRIEQHFAEGGEMGTEHAILIARR